MAVVLQQIVGKDHGGYYYPVFSGMARSYNFYSIGNIKPEEGIAYCALGLGKTIMEGENCLFFSPANPGSRTYDIEAYLPNPDGRLKSGMFARVSVPVGTRQADPSPPGHMKGSASTPAAADICCVSTMATPSASGSATPAASSSAVAAGPPSSRARARLSPRSPTGR